MREKSTRGERDVWGDADAFREQLRLRRVQRIGQAVELHHLLERRQQAEADDVEQRDAAIRHVTDAVALDHLLDELVLRRSVLQWLAQG